MAARTKTTKGTPAYRCTECGWTTAKWVGRCGECQTWGSVEEAAGGTVARTRTASSVQKPAQVIGEVDSTVAAYMSTGNPEFDRVLGGGLVPGAVILMAGEPGVGKSTLLLDVAATFARGYTPRTPAAERARAKTRDVLYVTGEESAAQVKLRADRIHAVADTLYLTSETDLGTALAHIEQVDPAMLVIDSVQTLASADVEGSAGGVTQVREVAASLIAAAKARNMCTLLVGHVTKEGTIAGPRLLEHLVDVVCQFEGDKHSNIRMLRAIKNRYGPTDEVGCFDMHEDGIAPVLDPSGMFVSRTPHPVAGTCVTVTMEAPPAAGRSPGAVGSSGGTRAQAHGGGVGFGAHPDAFGGLQRRAGLNVGKLDCYVSTVGGAKISEPAADLACVMALASAAQNKPLPRKLAVFGEVGLAGEVRAVPGIRQRIAEVGRLGFTHVLVPASPTGVGQVPDGVTVREVATLGEALNLLFPQDK